MFLAKNLVPERGSNPKPVLLATTYGVVTFSIIIQGLIVEKIVRAVVR